MKVKEDIITLGEQYILDNGTVINRYSHIVAGAEIGENSMIGQGCYVASCAIIGNNVKIQNHNNLWNGVTIEDNVFIGPRCCLTNDHNPSKENPNYPDKTLIKKGATLGTNVTVVAPCIIGECSMIGAASLVLRDIEDNERVNGKIK